MNIKTEVFWVVTPCSLVYVYRHFGGTSCLQISGKYVPHSTFDESGNRFLKMFIF